VLWDTRHVFELCLSTGDVGEAELSLSLGEPESGTVGREERKAHHRLADVSSLGELSGASCTITSL